MATNNSNGIVAEHIIGDLLLETVGAVVPREIVYEFLVLEREREREMERDGPEFGLMFESACTRSRLRPATSLFVL